MTNQDETKANILKGVNKKLKKRNLTIAAATILGCAAIGITAFSIFWANKPIVTAEEVAHIYVQVAKQGEITPYQVDHFKNQIADVKAYTKRGTINEADSRELAYNHIYIPFTNSLFGAPLADLGFFYAENHPDGTATLYYYLGDNAAQREYASKTQPFSGDGVTYVGDNSSSIFMIDMLVYPALVQQTEPLGEITKIYYLIYDYKNLDQAEFDQAKTAATLLWQK